MSLFVVVKRYNRINYIHFFLDRFHFNSFKFQICKNTWKSKNVGAKAIKWLGKSNRLWIELGRQYHPFEAINFSPWLMKCIHLIITICPFSLKMYTNKATAQSESDRVVPGKMYRTYLAVLHNSFIQFYYTWNPKTTLTFLLRASIVSWLSEKI